MLASLHFRAYKIQKIREFFFSWYSVLAPWYKYVNKRSPIWGIFKTIAGALKMIIIFQAADSSSITQTNLTHTMIHIILRHFILWS